jgi:hypothetical protein
MFRGHAPMLVRTGSLEKPRESGGFAPCEA